MFALCDIAYGRTILTIPRSALLNATTPGVDALQPPRGQLAATQVVSLYLARHRPPSKPPSPDFAPFIDSLPRDFDSTPLTHGEAWASIIALGPASLQLAVADVERRLNEDWTRVQQAVPEHLDGVTRDDFVWGWLAANSRSVSIELGLPDRVDNWTLAPLFDMANHDPDSSVVARFGPQSISLVSSDEEVAVPLDRVGKPAIAAGTQVTFEYGAHTDEVLCAEYGFVMPHGTNRFATIDVTENVDMLFDTLEPDQLSTIREMLQAHNFDRDYAIQLSPPLASPSHRTLVALRLFHFVARRSGVDSEDSWISMIVGETDTISDANEALVHASLRSIGEDVATAAQRGLDRLEAARADHPTAAEAARVVEHIWRGHLRGVEQLRRWLETQKT